MCRAGVYSKGFRTYLILPEGKYRVLDLKTNRICRKVSQRSFRIPVSSLVYISREGESSGKQYYFHFRGRVLVLEKSKLDKYMMPDVDMVLEDYLKMKELLKDISNCTRCELHKSRTHVVPGHGSFLPTILFVGEAPGKNEDASGLPFVGRAGGVFRQMVAQYFPDIPIFITNILKCRPPRNRDPKEPEVKACRPFLERQIQILNPGLIVAVGRHSTNLLLDSKRTLSFSQVRQKVYQSAFMGIPLIPCYHPAATLYNPNLRVKLEEDFKFIKNNLSRVVGLRKKQLVLG